MDGDEAVSLGGGGLSPEKESPLKMRIQVEGLACSVDSPHPEYTDRVLELCVSLRDKTTQSSSTTRDRE